MFSSLYKWMLCLVLFTSCNKYLDVQPEDRFLSEQVFSSKQSAQNALNGIYLNIAKTGMYGAGLTSTTVDVLAQYYNYISGVPYYSLASYNFTEANARTHVENLWKPSYTALLNLNLFMENFNASRSLFSDDEAKLITGEVYGLRACIGFDLLRLFGPVYAANPNTAAIPYPVNSGERVHPILNANVVMDSVLADLARATGLLQSDPVRREGVVNFASDGGNNFFRMRNRRMNYYAAQALLARVLLYKGDKPGALKAATSVISEAGKWFPWSPSALSVPGIANPDRIFSSEVLMGVPNIDMYNIQASFFNASLTTNILAPVTAKLEGVYEGFLNDYRYRCWFEVDRYTSRIDKTFFKYVDVTSKSLQYRNLQPMLRISEMYLVAAECETDEAKAQGYFNTLQANRGLPDINFNGNRTGFITKEYQKEFWGEGQLFFYYKRNNIASIVSGVNGTSAIAMTAARYVLPLPLSETENR